MHKTFGDVEWITIFFFVGLFVVVHGVEVGGLLHLLANALVTATGGDMATAGYAILWASAFLSAIVDKDALVEWKHPRNVQKLAWASSLALTDTTAPDKQPA